MIHIDDEAVLRLATVGSLVEPLRRAFASNAASPPRAHYDLDSLDPPSNLLLMPAWQPHGAIGVKIVTVFPRNAAHGLPSVNAAYLLLSGQTGQPRAYIDGRSLTLLRTAAVSALAADLLAPQAAAVLLMVGTGALARYLIEGHRAVRRYRSIMIWGRDAQKAAAVARDLEARGWPVSVAKNLEAAARSADVISCATLAQHALIQGAWLKADCHLDLVGSFQPAMREADDACMQDAFIAIDTLAALDESGDLVEPLARGVMVRGDIAPLGGLITSRAVPPRPGRTVFKSVGVAHADLAVAEYLFERHRL